MTTALTAYLANAASAESPTNGNQLYDIAGSPSVAVVGTVMGTATGYGVLYPNGASAWASGTGLGAANGRGWFLDTAILDGQTIQAGTWSAAITLRAVQSGVGAGTLTSDIIVRVSRYSGGTYTTIATLTLAGQTISATATTFSVSASSVPSAAFATGERLFIDIWLNITANTNGSTSQAVRVQRISTDTTGYSGDPAAAITTPGFNQTPITVTAAVSENADPGTGSGIVAIAGYVAIATEHATATELIGAYQQSIASTSANMTSAEMDYQYARVLASVTGPQIKVLAKTYYGMSTKSNVVYGELDALLIPEAITQLHVMRSVSDVTAFLQAVEYESNVLNDSPLAYYRFGDASGSMTAADIGGRGYTGNLYGGVTPGVSGALAASTDTAMQFDGSTGYVQLPGGVNSANWQAITLEAWIKPTNASFSGFATIAGNDNPVSTNNGVLFGLTNSIVTLYVGMGTAYYAASASISLVSGTWYHLVAKYNGSNLVLCINGAQVKVQSGASGLIATASGPITIGNAFPGVIDEPAIYPAALATPRIAAHYAAGTNP